MRIGDRVIVDAAVTGDGVHHHGKIKDMEIFAGKVFVDVQFDEPDSKGWPGASVTNIEMLRRETEL